MKLIKIVLLLACFCTLAYASQPENPNNIQFVTLADIHFDPFIACHRQVPCPLINELREAPASAWPAIFSAHRADTPQYRQDTNYDLLTSAMTAAKQAAQQHHAKFVLVLGDFLGHDFRKLYKKYTQDKTLTGYQEFVNKTLTFLNNELASTFNHTTVFALVGNNDSYGGDYYSNPQGRFYSDTGQLWGSLIKDKQQRAEMQRQFSRAGYYAVNIAPNLRLIMMNTVLFSYKVRGKNVKEAATAELTWLHEQLLAARENHQHVLIAMHIPIGVDVYAFLKFRLFRLIEFWEQAYAKQFEAELEEFAPEITGILAAHLHMDWFQILTLPNHKSLPVIGTPAISPIFGNNPGFKLFTYSPEKGELENFITYYDTITHYQSWGVEYSFDKIYKPNCVQCPVATGISQITPKNMLADYYKIFYAVGTTSQPIQSKWYPYYWCAINYSHLSDYQNCIK